MKEMQTPDEKGITKVERYVLGLEMKDVNDVPVLQPEQTTSTETVRVTVSNIEPKDPAVTGAEVKYSIVTASKPDFSDKQQGDQQASPTFDLPLPDSGVKYYRVKIDLVKPTQK